MRIAALFVVFNLFGPLVAQPDYRWLDDDMLTDPEYISHVSESPDGFYWLGNTTGLIRFDGSQTKVIRIKDPGNPIEHNNEVSSRMFPDGKGKLWFTTINAIHSYQMATGRIATFQVAEQLEKDETAADYYGILFNEKSGHLWLRAGDGIYAFSPETGKSSLLGAPARGVSFSHHTDAEGGIRIWGSAFIENNLEMLSISGSDQDTIYRVLSSPLFFVHTLALGGNRLLASTNRGLQEITVGDTVLQARPVSQELPQSTCYSSARSSRPGYFWTCFPKNGVFEVEVSTGRITRQILNGTDSGLRAPQYLYFDQRANLWVTDRNKGLLIVPKATSSFHVVPLKDDDRVTDLFEDEVHDIWVITKAGNLYQITYPQRKVREQTPLLGNINSYVGRFYPFGEYWLLYGQASMHRRTSIGRKWTGITTPNNVFKGLVNTRQRSLKITGSSVHYFSIQSDSLRAVIPPQGESLVSNSHRLLPHSDSTFLLNTQDGCILQYLAQPDSSLILLRADTIRASVYAHLRAKDSTIYLGTENGLYRYDANTTVRVFNEIGPFYSSSISSIGEDRSGNLWIGTSNGLLCYNPKTKAVRRYSKEDGLPSNQFTEATPVTLPDGMLYMATTEGLVSFRPEEVLANEPPIQPYLSEVWVNQLPLSTDSSLLDLNRLRLPYARNTIDLSLGLIGLQQSGLAGFTYQLLGLEDAAGFVSAGQRIKYPKLPPGEYAFEYSAINRHGKRFEPRRLAIVVVPKFTQTWTFFFLVALSILVILASAYAWLLRRERARQTRLREDREKILTERERIAAELHDDLGGDLASMVFIIDGHEYLREQGVQSELDVRRIGDLANGAIRNMREMIWVLDDSQTTPAALAEQLLTVARQMALAAELNFQADIADDLPVVSLSSAQKKNVLLIAKESIQNIRKHARAQGFHLRFVAEQLPGRHLILEITDNGRGLAAAGNDPKKRNHGHGMTNLTKRATAIGGTLTLTPALPAGTRMRLTLPLFHPPD